MKMTLVVLLLLAASTHGFGKNEFFSLGRQQLPDFCMDYFGSSSAKLMPANVDRQLFTMALETEDDLKKQTEFQILTASIQSLAEKKYPDHICDAREFAPSILSADYPFTCAEICQHCMPGSAPICFQRNPRYTGLAQVCLCTYDLEMPVEKAAFSLRHEKRIFSRKIRRT